MESNDYRKIVVSLLIDKIMYKLKNNTNKIYPANNLEIILDVLHNSPDGILLNSLEIMLNVLHNSHDSILLNSLKIKITPDIKEIIKFLYDFINRNSFNVDDDSLHNRFFFEKFKKFKELLNTKDMYYDTISKLEIIGNSTDIGIYYPLCNNGKNTVGFYMMYRNDGNNTLELFIDSKDKYESLNPGPLYEFLK